MNDLGNRLPAASRRTKKDSGIKKNDGQYPCRSSTSAQSCNRDHDARTPGGHGTREKDKVSSHAVRGRIRYKLQDGLKVYFDLDGIDQYYELHEKHQQDVSTQDLGRPRAS